MANHKDLATARDVVRVLGGPAMVSQITGLRRSAISNWGGPIQKKLPARTYLILTTELKRIGHAAPYSLWSMIPPNDQEDQVDG